MSIRMKIAFGCYLLLGLVATVFGLTYMLSSRIMPYHQEVVGGNWEDLSPRIQKMFLTLLHGSGTAMFLSGLLGLILLFIPFRRGEVWSRWALAILYVPAHIAALYSAVDLHQSTHAATPWRLSAFMTALVLVAALLSMQ